MDFPVIQSVGLISRRGYSPQMLQNIHYNTKEFWNFTFPPSFEKSYYKVSMCAKLGVFASELACRTQRFPGGDRSGVYCGTWFGGNPSSQKIQCDALIRRGPAGILPGMSIHNGYHLTADLLAIRYHITGKNSTTAAGAAASGMALLEAYDDIRFEKVDNALVAGMEDVDDILQIGLNRFPKYSNIQNSSGAAALVLARGSSANGKKPIYLKSVECCVYSESGSGKGVEELLQKSMERCAVQPEHIKAIVITDASDEATPLWSPVLNKLKQAQCMNTGRQFGNTLGASSVMGVAQAFLLAPQLPLAQGEHILILSSAGGGVLWAAIIGR